MNDIKVFSIGKIVNEEENVKVVVEQKYAEGLIVDKLLDNDVI